MPVAASFAAIEPLIFKCPPWNSGLRIATSGAPLREGFLPFRSYVEQSLVVFMTQSRRSS